MSQKYVEDVKASILDKLVEIREYDADKFVDMDDDDIYEELYDMLWSDDSVTGNGSGSYFFDREKAMKFVIDDGFETVEEAISDGLYSTSKLGEDIIDWNWETIDVICRLTVLHEALTSAIRELGGAKKAVGSNLYKIDYI